MSSQDDHVEQPTECPDSLLDEYVRGECAPHVHDEITAHVAGCARCKVAVGSLIEVDLIATLRSPAIKKILSSENRKKILAKVLRAVAYEEGETWEHKEDSLVDDQRRCAVESEHIRSQRVDSVPSETW